MANVEDLLRKQKDRIEKIDPSISPSATRKKIARTGPSRPWQENLPQYQKSSVGTETDKEDEVIKFAIDASPESGSNLVQNGFITGSGSGSNLVQNGFITGSDKLGQLDTKIRTSSETGSESSSNLVHNKFITSSNLTKLNGSLPVRGSQCKILTLLFDLSSHSGDLTTPPLPSDVFVKRLGIGTESARTAIKRLIKNGHIERINFRRGRAGWTQYAVSQTTFKKLLTNHQTSSNLVHNGFTTGPQTSSETGSTSSSSSSFNIDAEKKLTTTRENQIVDQQESDLPPEWEAIDFSDLILWGVHFGRPQLKQWYDRNYCTAEQAQESIYHFAFYLKHSKQGDIKTGPLNFFMGIMAKQKYFARPDGYLSPEEEGMKRRAEDLKKKSENLKRIEQELYEHSFDIWFRSLTEDDIQDLAPNIFQYEPRKVVLRQVFLDKHWLKIKSNPNLDPAKLDKPSIFEAKTSGQAKAIEPEELTQEEISLLIDQSLGLTDERAQ